MVIYIYCIVQDNKPIYIGQTINKKSRLWDHKRRFGKDIDLVVLSETTDADVAFRLEWYFIMKLNKLGYNLHNKVVYRGYNYPRTPNC